MTLTPTVLRFTCQASWMVTVGQVAQRPLLRGWFHVYATPVALATGIVLLCLAPGGAPRVGAAVYLVGATAIFAVSATYHRWAWSSSAARRSLWKRADHAVIFLGIASTYTPVALTVLHGTERVAVLWVAWSGAIVGASLELLLQKAPKLLTVPLYIAEGWIAVFVVPSLLHGAGVAALVLLFTGGAFYTVGAIVYATGKPALNPRVFGPHEAFHAGTVAGYACHAVVMGLVLLQ
jgi:hemolysin III